MKGQNSQKTRNLLFIFIALFSILLIFFILYFLILSIYFFFLSYQEDDPSQQYLYQEVDPSSNRTTFGFVYTNKQLPAQGFISYSKNDGGRVFISQNAGPRYRCTGTCVCRSDNKRRVSSVLTRGLFLMITALSSTIAIQMAVEKFGDDCIEKWVKNDPGTCEDDDVEIDGVDCFPDAHDFDGPYGVGDSRETDADAWAKPYSEEIKDKKEVEAEFLCIGRCLPHEYLFLSGIIEEREMEYFQDTNGKCDNHRVTGRVVAKVITGMTPDHPNNYEDGDPFFAPVPFVDVRKGRQTAIKEFAKKYLEPLCKKMSYRTRRDGNREDLYFCTHYDRYNRFPYERNIACVTPVQDIDGNPYGLDISEADFEEFDAFDDE